MRKPAGGACDGGSLSIQALWRLGADRLLRCAVRLAGRGPVRSAERRGRGADSGEVAGFTAYEPLAGSIRSNDLFTEVSLPMLSDRPLAHAVEVTLGYRLSDERDADPVGSYKAELGWTLTQALRLRGSFQRAVRSPDIFERYEPPVEGDALASDPCAVGNPARTAQVLALCRRQAVLAGFDPSTADDLVQEVPDATVLNSGNPNLEPERPGRSLWARSGDRNGAATGSAASTHLSTGMKSRSRTRSATSIRS
jgi:hypothetical protein